MDRRKNNSCRATKYSRWVKLFTKKQISKIPERTTAPALDVPVKVRRTLLRRTALNGHSAAQAVGYIRDTPLSELYKPELRELYIDQLYTVIKKIGQGCFGDVFFVESKEDNQYWAIKVSNDTHAFIDFGEVRRWEKINEHKNCVKFVRAWQQNFHLYIQMELCLTSLDKVILANHYIREPQCWDILIDVCEGLKNLHDDQLLHMDIKPANIMVTADGVCKLGDFGLVYDLKEVDAATNKPIERTGVSVSEGDGKYVALEVLQGKKTKAADIFSLGIMMMEVASDVALPSSGHVWEALRKGELPVCYVRRRLSKAFRQLITDMIQLDYSKRPEINDILRHKSVVHTMANHAAGKRVNYLSNWEDQMLAYHQEYPDSMVLDIPGDHNRGPSPPRRPYAINYLPPNDNTTPRLSRFNSAEDEENKEEMEVEIESRTERVRRVSRRLFD